LGCAAGGQGQACSISWSKGNLTATCLTVASHLPVDYVSAVVAPKREFVTNNDKPLIVAYSYDIEASIDVSQRQDL
jgi:hypothetical protein